MSRRKNFSKLEPTSLNFLETAYGITSQVVNSYHIKLRHEEYDGWFDWYHTTGTLIANRNGGTNNLGHIKKDEDVALKITRHIQNGG